MGKRLRADREADRDDPQAIEADVARSHARITGAPVVMTGRVADPSLVGAVRVEAVPPPEPRTNLKDPVPCVAVAHCADGSTTVDTASVKLTVDGKNVPLIATGNPDYPWRAEISATASGASVVLKKQ